ncbi:hypothetical protein [Novosphingobium sp. 9]|uniref:tetratricopeptide repeat protein n=1 Tax=Novosphingobium sp. 9 TaxID=2025349 RepID=UPI0028CB6B06|nr:hypothetical protein [Novosphingobium sp. 9]
MRHFSTRPLLATLSIGILAATAPALADVKAGVDAWSAGNYDAAIRDWKPLADAGDPDAEFNLAQAYKMGRGVPLDLDKAEELYGKAAAQGHVQAADTYGLLLFQRGIARRRCLMWKPRPNAAIRAPGTFWESPTSTAISCPRTGSAPMPTSAWRNRRACRRPVAR